MRPLDLILRLFSARSWSGRIAALAAVAIAGYAFWQGELGAASLPTNASTQLHGRVVGVMDGDTLELLDNGAQTVRVRLAYIDAPEHDQPYGTRARQHLAGLVFGQQISVQVHGKDKYGRVLGDVSRDGQDIGAAQLAAGLAWHYVYYAKKEQPSADYQHYQQQEQAARSQGQGLWQEVSPLAPWDFRRNQRNQ